MNAHDSPVIVCSFPRSGSTLLGRVLNTHRDLCIWGENMGLLAAMVDQFEAVDWSWATHLTAAQVKESNNEFIPVNVPYTGEKLREAFKEVVLKFYAEELPETTRWGYKDLNHYTQHDLSGIRKLFPGAQFIVLRREGRASCSSAILAPWVRDKLEAIPATQRGKAREEIDDLVASTILTYVEFDAFANKAKSRDDTLVLEYENLIRNPEAILERTSRFLRLELSGWDETERTKQLQTRRGETPRNGSYSFLTYEFVQDRVERLWAEIVTYENPNKRKRNLKWNAITGRNWRWY